jgi:cellulose synthase/poly-beta-1,6-N-acetylglucosamine synthase-like glycosyltransferase
MEIGREYEDRGVRLMHRPQRQGKSAALNRAVAQARWDIVFFSDANTDYPPNVVEMMVRNLSDPRVGGVSGRKIVLQDDDRAATQGERAFWSYESFLKIQESSVGSIVVADGEIFAMRKGLYRPIPAGMVHDDMYQTLSIVQSGHRVVYENDATSSEHASRNLRDEFHLKVRYASAGYQIFFAFLPMFVPPRSLFAVQFISHKLLRWMAPLFLVGLFAANALIGSPFYRAMLWLQVAFYVVALLASLLPSGRRTRLLYFPLYFCMGNAAALYGLFKFLGGGQSALWRKAER